MSKKIEAYTEHLVLSEMNIAVGHGNGINVMPQGYCENFDKIESCLKNAGGKPQQCDLDDYTSHTTGKAKPEFIITIDDNVNTIFVIECKKSEKKHETKLKNEPNNYAVDGVLFYAKYLKAQYNVIAIAVSGTSIEKMKVSSFYWAKNANEFFEIPKTKDILLEPNNYLKIINGEKIKRAYSIDEIRNTALLMHNTLREIKVSEKHKPLFIAGILIALESTDFTSEYSSSGTFASVINKLNYAIDEVLKSSDIKKEKIDHVLSAFKIIGKNEKLKSIPLGEKNSIIWYIEQLEMKIKPMMEDTSSSIDSLGIFYHEFVKYSGGDGKGLGIVLTPQHLTEFMCDIASLTPESKVLDICCGSGSFLVTAMSKMIKKSTTLEEVENIKRNGIYGIELDIELYTLSVANMIIRKDGKSNIYHGDCFNKDIAKTLREKDINVGLINPPYSQKDVVELEFIEQMLSILKPGNLGIAVVPVSSAIGTKFLDVRERLLKNHTLDAVFSMPDEIFYPTATNVCVMVWIAKKPHDSGKETFFGYYKDDGYEKRKNLGRVDINNEWSAISEEWKALYFNRDIKPGISARAKIDHEKEWLCEAYMKISRDTISQEKFEGNIKNYLAFKITNSTDTIIFNNDEVEKLELGDINNWGEFKVSDLFNISRGKRITTDLYQNNFKEYPVVTAKTTNNGIDGRYEKSNAPSNIITVCGEVSGMKAFYQSEKTFVLDTVRICVPKFELNIYRALFITTLFGEYMKLYSFGRKLKPSNLEETYIYLPTTQNNNINWEFIDKFMYSLPYGSNL